MKPLTSAAVAAIVWARTLDPKKVWKWLEIGMWVFILSVAIWSLV